MKQSNMKVIGITGGVGCGKSSVLKYIEDNYNAFIIRSDELAKELEKRNEVCYRPLVDLLGNTILDDNLEINPKKMASAIFEGDSDEKLKKVNEIIHPCVKRRILELIDLKKKEGLIDYFFIEAALLIEDNYDKICEELWYVYASVETRTKRLKESRGYSAEKIEGIMASQLDEETFRKHCKITIDNDGDITNTINQLINLFN